MKKSILNVLLAAALLTSFTACENKASLTETQQDNMESSAETAGATAQPVSSTSAADAPVMSFESQEYDFGTIKEGEVVTHVYKFTNTGKTPLIVQSATAQCGCTVPQKPEKPVAPGEASEIKVEFNSKGKAGIQSKAITITANTEPATTTLVLKGIVNADAVSAMQGPLRAN